MGKSYTLCMSEETGGTPIEAIKFDAAKAKANFEASLKKDFDTQPAEKAFQKEKKDESENRERDRMLSAIAEIIDLPEGEERNQKIDELVNSRLEELTAVTEPRKFIIVSKPVKGFLHPESEVSRSLIVDPFKVDDPDIYKDLIESFQEFKRSPAWEARTLREVAPFAIQRAIGKYFGNHFPTGNAEKVNRAFYMDRSDAFSEPFSIRELKGKNFAVCAEKSSVTQNLLAFLGYESELVATTKARLNSPEQDDQDGHMYNIISRGENHQIFDPTNPVLVKDENGSVRSVFPALYSIDEEKYQELMGGGQVQIVHNDRVFSEGKYINGPDKVRIYGGPK